MCDKTEVLPKDFVLVLVQKNVFVSKNLFLLAHSVLSKLKLLNWGKKFWQVGPALARKSSLAGLPDRQTFPLIFSLFVYSND